MIIKISPTTVLEIKSFDLTSLEDESNFIEFDYQKAALEFFNSFKNETCDLFVEHLKDVLQYTLNKSEESLNKITKRCIEFKSRETLQREEISKNILKNTKSF